VSGAAPLRVTTKGIELQVRLTPKSSRDAVDGVELRGEVSVLKARVRAVPEDGKANAALEALVADWVGVARRSVEVTAGGKSRLKTVTISGDGRVLAAVVTAMLAKVKS